MSRTNAVIVAAVAFAAGILVGLATAALTSDSVRELTAQRDELAREVCEKTAEVFEVRRAAEILRREAVEATKVMEGTAKLIDDKADASYAAEIALRDGDGDDWIDLTDNEKMVLCVEVASRLGKVNKLAWAYRQFLDSFYEQPEPLARETRIAEAIVCCQVFIENGEITLE